MKQISFNETCFIILRVNCIYSGNDFETAVNFVREYKYIRRKEDAESYSGIL